MAGVTPAAHSMASAKANPVLVFLMVSSVMAWLVLSSVSVAPNRIVPGSSVGVFGVAGWPGVVLGLLPVIIAGVLALKSSRRQLVVVALLVVLTLAALPLWLALAAHNLVSPELPGARLGIGAGIWVVLFLLLLSVIEVRTRLGLSRWQGGLLLLIPMMSFSAVLIATPWLDSLALRREFVTRSDAFYTAIGEHLLLVSASVGCGLVIGVTLALIMRHWPRLRGPGFALLNFLQTIPSLALFGLLIAPLAWLAANHPWLASLGISGIGWAPALLALIGYSLLPLVRNTFVALDDVDPGVIDAARGMGMTSGQVFRQVRLPLALPVLLEGIRITTVQAIGLAAVAALIGAGGLGRFIFQGLGQAAMDLVLLGALPILIMALLADALLGALGEWLQPGGAA
ncbi:ABC transporter permease [Halomonas halocynthiae]|uniref:ABC transporter permease n=1 Tax=Halomonas halocynthiae TaxID=176290 RepID=UPI0003F4D075|nr:ABC transporter permease [Halomonas halocynthiae]